MKLTEVKTSVRRFWSIVGRKRLGGHLIDRRSRSCDEATRLQIACRYSKGQGPYFVLDLFHVIYYNLYRENQMIILYCPVLVLEHSTSESWDIETCAFCISVLWIHSCSQSLHTWREIAVVKMWLEWSLWETESCKSRRLFHVIL